MSDQDIENLSGASADGQSKKTIEEILEERRQALIAAKGSGEPGDPGSDARPGPDIEIGPVRDVDDVVNDTTFLPTSPVRTVGYLVRGLDGKVPRKLTSR